MPIFKMPIFNEIEYEIIKQILKNLFKLFCLILKFIFDTLIFIITKCIKWMCQLITFKWKVKCEPLNNLTGHTYLKKIKYQ